MKLSTRTRLAIALVWGLFWLLMVLVEIEDYRRRGGQSLWKPILWIATSMLVVTALMAIQWRANLRHPVPASAPARWFLRQAMWLPMYWICFTPLAFGLRHGAYALVGEQYTHAPWPAVFAYESVKITLLLILVAAAAFGLQSWYEMMQEKLRAEHAQVRLREAQLAQLTQQMQPHFLFNALNTIGGLMHVDVARADATLTQLASLLRTTLTLGERSQAPLGEEIGLAQAYASIMGERFDGRVTVAWDIEPDALGVKVPTMSIQPLLENVFKHTVERQRAPVAIRVAAGIDAGLLSIEVSDDSGTLAPTEPAGIGLSNLRSRLAALYGDQASLTLAPRHPTGVSTLMRLPCGF